MTMADKKRDDPRRRGNGEGALYQRRDGRWEARITLPDGTRRSFYRKTKQDAIAARTKALGAILEGSPVTPEKQTVGEYLTKWLEASAHDLAPRTVTRYRNHIMHSLTPAFGRFRLAKLGPQPIQSLYARKLAEGVSPGSVRQMHAVLRKALGEAARLGLVPRNVATLVKPPRAVRHEMQVLSPEEARTLLAEVAGDRLEALYVLALTTGMRIGEMCALRWTDVDLPTLADRHTKAAAVHVRATLRYINSDVYYFDPPKTAQSRRRISLSGTAAEALKLHRIRQLEERLAAGVAWRDEDLVFTTPIGAAVCANHLGGREFHALLKRAGLPRIRFHDLRHTCATLLLRRGVHPKVVSELLGHSTVTMTLDRYSHVLPDMQQAAIDAMDGLLG
jgi:integrase